MIRTILASAFAMSMAAPAYAAATVGQPAPDFTLTDANGKPVRLSAFRGKPVVLEWNNPGCPFVKKHYDSGNMQKTQNAAKALGAVWLSINSGGPGKQGYMTGPQAAAFQKTANAQPSAYLLDAKGTVGHSYSARTTPQIFIVDAGGKLVYSGAIDDKPTADAADIKGARNHALAALTELKAGKPISVASSKPYGCSVKYAS